MKNIPRKIRHKVPAGRGLKFELVFLAVSVLAIFCCALPAMRTAGWPQGTDFDYKTELYAKHLQQGDILPIWSADDAYGIGSPLPLYYHKTFYYVSGPLLLITNSIKVATLLSLGLFMLVGAYGMRWCLRKFTDHELFTILVSPIILFANYTFTDWLVRDDMAEFVAMMLVPWLVWWCLKLIMEKRFSLAIVPILFLLINAHNVIALFGMVPVGLAYGLFLLRERKPGFHRTLKPALKSTGLLVLLLLPLLTLEKIFLRTYDPSKITQAGYLATSNFHPFSQYLYYPNYSWLNSASLYTIQIDFAILIPLAGLLIWVIIQSLRQRSFKLVKKVLANNVILFLAGCLAIFIFLQMGISKPLYFHIPPMQFLQFPWRLLIYITILGILLVAYLVTRYDKKLFLSCFGALWLLSFVLLSPAFKTVQHSYTNPRGFAYTVPEGQKPGFGTMMGIGEYLPRVYTGNRELASLQVSALYGEKFLANREAEVIGGGPCKIDKHPQAQYELLTIYVDISCTEPAQVALPVSYNDFSTIRNTQTNKVMPYSRTTLEDPRIIIAVTKTNKTTFKIELPTAPRVIKTWL